MSAMTAVVVGAAGPGHAGVASGILNAARQSGGALGVALLGALLGGAGSGPGRAPSLHVPLAVAVAGYLVALTLAWITIRDRR
jgi:MFS transporter, DHA2 family, methylenomycin A resistance protein